MSNGEVVREACPGTGGVLVDGDRLYPVDDVLERQMRARSLGDIERGPRIAWLGANVSPVDNREM